MRRASGPFLFGKMLKKIVLFVALAAPVLIFAFLKLFGKNEFEVPVYWANGVAVNGCAPKPGLYTLPDSALQAWGWRGDHATLIVLDEGKTVSDNLARVADLFNEGDYATIQARNVPACLLLAGDSSKVVLVDEQKRIRGYYTPTTERETDRLGVELRILLKQY